MKISVKLSTGHLKIFVYGNPSDQMENYTQIASFRPIQQMKIYKSILDSWMEILG